jgi:hypothetical protein
MVLGKVTPIIQTLESVRTKLEDRFIQAGATMAAALDGVEALIQSLDRLNGALEGDASTEADGALQSAAADLLALPALQAERRTAFEALVQKSERLGANIEHMRTMLRYLRAFALNLKVTAAAAAEFSGFAEELMEKIAIGAETLALFGAKLAELDKQLRLALDFVCELEADCEQVLPFVARDLQSSAEAIEQHNREINATAARVADLARDIRRKVGAALISMQIGDNTRQRIEHVQAGLALLESPSFAEIADEPAANTLRRLLLGQLADLSETFAGEAQRVSDNLIGLNGDAREVLRLKALIGEGEGADFLRDLEDKVGQAHGVVDRVRMVNTQAGQAGRAVAGAVEALLANVDAIQSVKTEIRYMAINTSLRCSRMGPEGRPVNVVGMELRAGADKLGETADHTIGDLDGLSEGANRFVAHDTEIDLGRELDHALSSIHQARDSAEAELDAVSRGSAEVAETMDALSANAHFHDDLRSALWQAQEALEDITGAERVTGEADPALSAALDEIFALYTMDREREIHRRFAPAAAGRVVALRAVAAPAQDDDVLFAGALF